MQDRSPPFRQRLLQRTAGPYMGSVSPVACLRSHVRLGRWILPLESASRAPTEHFMSHIGAFRLCL